MGRYDFRPARIHKTTSQLLATERIARPPPWFDVVGGITPSQILVRTQPVKHDERRNRTKKASKLFKPQEITYQEDRLRKEFFSDHPWELARPRVIVEEDGKDYRAQDWSSIRSRNHPISGESVIQRQMYLMEKEKMTKSNAYDQARREFYEQRMQEDVERRVAKEEALATGAFFGKSMVQIGAELEDQAYEQWREFAEKSLRESEQASIANSGRMSAPPIASAEEPDDVALSALDSLEEEAVEIPAKA